MFRFRKRIDPIAGVMAVTGALLGCSAAISIVMAQPIEALGYAVAGGCFAITALLVQFVR